MSAALETISQRPELSDSRSEVLHMLLPRRLSLQLREVAKQRGQAFPEVIRDGLDHSVNEYMNLTGLDRMQALDKVRERGEKRRSEEPRIQDTLDPTHSMVGLTFPCELIDRVDAVLMMQVATGPRILSQELIEDSLYGLVETLRPPNPINS